MTGPSGEEPPASKWFNIHAGSLDFAVTGPVTDQELKAAPKCTSVSDLPSALMNSGGLPVVSWKGGATGIAVASGEAAAASGAGAGATSGDAGGAAAARGDGGTETCGRAALVS